MSGIKSCIEKINNNKSGEYEKDYTKIKFNSDNKLPLNKQLKFLSVTIVIRFVFVEDGKYCPQDFLDDCLFEVQTPQYYRIDISEGIDINQTNALKECNICYYCYFLDKNFNYELYLSNGYNNLMQKATSFDNFAILSIKGNSYRIHFWHISKNDAINITKNSNL